MGLNLFAALIHPALYGVALHASAWRAPRTSTSRRGPGWTQAQVKRMARKACNRGRNRRAHRKGKRS